MSLERRAIEAALERKGFRRSDRDHRRYHFYTQAGRKTPISTQTSHGSGKYKVLSDELVSRMARQLALTTGEFVDFVSCNLERDQYERILIERQKC